MPVLPSHGSGYRPKDFGDESMAGRVDSFALLCPALSPVTFRGALTGRPGLILRLVVDRASGAARASPPA